ncbi:MAG: dihydroorotate dehydrogenase [Spirochaetes bacterium RBG_13_68_11]|nr:MAG: dihydroorotate dehydrogenase [Spirochaetes bacterium RBG_13_68_11]
MADLQTSYLGIALKNPIIAGASDLTADLDGIRRIEEAGAGAIVLKSLFEEQIQLERFKLAEDFSRGEARYAEMATIFPKLEHAGPKEHLMGVRAAKAAVKVPVIASLNCVNRATWVEYAKALADESVDALELNFFATPRDPEVSGTRVEEEQLEIVRAVKAAVALPVSVKLSISYSNLLNFISRLDREGVAGVVLFNRFFQPDIDPLRESIGLPFNFSHPVESRLPLRFAGLLFGRIKADVCASTGIMSGTDAARMLLAGSSAVQVVTALYRAKVGAIAKMVADLGAWMDGKGYRTLADFRGSLSEKNAEDSWAYTRAQYAKMLLNPKQFIEEVGT